jgi:hypothetical protein
MEWSSTPLVIPDFLIIIIYVENITYLIFHASLSYRKVVRELFLLYIFLKYEKVYNGLFCKMLDLKYLNSIICWTQKDIGMIRYQT